MADLKLVGAVAIKVRPDATGFRREAQRELDKELKGVKATVPVEAEFDEGKVKEDAKKLEKELNDGKTITWNVKLDHDSVRAAQKKFDSMMEPTSEIKFKLGDEKSIKAAAARLQELADKAKVKITYAQDEKGYQSVLDKIAAIRREKLEIPLEFDTDDEELDRIEKDMRSKLAKAAGDKLEIKGTSTIKFEYDENRESFEALLADIDAELAKFKDQTIYVNADEETLRKARRIAMDALSELPVKFRYDDNKAGLEEAIKEIDARLAEVRTKLEIEALLDEESLLAARAKLVADLKDIRETVEITYSNDRASMQKALDEIDKALAEIDKVTIEVGTNPFELAWTRADIEAAMAKIPATIEYDKNVAGIKKAIAEIDAELAKIDKAKIETTLDPLNLAFTKARLEEELGHQEVHLEYETGDLSSLKAARARIMALLPIEHKTHITTELNEASLLKSLAKLDRMIKAATPDVKPEVKPKVSTPDFLKTLIAIKTLAKSQTVDIFVKLNNASVFLAAAKLTGLRAASRWTEGFAKTLGSLDRNLPIVAAAVLGVNSLTSGFISLASSAFSLGNDLGTVVRMAGLLAPAMILGFAAVKTVMTGVFKDFGAAVNGDDKAIEKLTESGKKAAANMRVIFQDIRETVSKNFWKAAGDSMLEFTKTALPSVRDGMKGLSTSMGGVFASIVDATSKFAKEDGFLVFFQNLTRGFDNVKSGMAPFMSAFLNLAALGSTIFPRMGAAFDGMSQKFDAWVKGLASDGSFSRWIDQGVQGIKDLWSTGMSLIGIWKNIGAAAQGAGALTLHSFSLMTAKLEEVTSGYRFQTNISRIFQGARDGSEEFHKSLTNLGPAMDSFSVTLGNALANSGKALGAFINVLGDVLSSSNLDKGLTAFLGGVKTMFEELRPAAAPITEILRTFGEILGAVARDSGPLFRTLFTQLATVLTTAWHALEPFLPALIQVGTTIIGVLGPAMAAAADKFIPAFAGGLADLGDGLIPVIQNLADFALGIVGMISDTPLPVIVGITTGILALSGAFTFVTAVAPFATAAMQLFGIEAGVAAIRTQLLIPVVGLALAALTGFALAGVANLATNMKSGTSHSTEYATALREDAKAAGEFGNAIGTATTKLALQKLMSDGAFDAAKNLGIGYKDVYEAVLKGGGAMDGLKGKLDGAQKGFEDQILAIRKTSTGWDDFQNKTQNARFGIDQINKLRDALDLEKGSLDEAAQGNAILAQMEKDAGVEAEGQAKKTDSVTEALKKQKSHIAAAASATGVLTDAFASSSSKIDAMRKTFDILLGKDAKQQAAEALGAYAKGFNDLKASVEPIAQEMRNLGEAAYGDNGFLNVASGNKAVLQVNQALTDEVNNIWAGAKDAYDNALVHGQNATVAFERAQEFIRQHEGDYNALAEASGVSADRVRGQWDAVFGHEWVLKVSLQGATEAATRAQELVTALKGNFDGQDFIAYLDANPDAAMKAISDPTQAALDYVNHTWKAKLEAAPQPALDALKGLKGLTQEQWNNGDFMAILKCADQVPGLAEALQAIRNGAAGDYEAIIKAITDGISLAEARRQLDIATATRTVVIQAIMDRSQLPDLNGDASGSGRPGVANGGFFRSVRGTQDLFKGMFQAGIFKAYANGGVERHVAQIASGRGPVRFWGERETQGEAYIPLASSKRPRSLAILSQVAKEFGYTISKATEYANGGMAGHAGPTNTTNASVTIGNLYTTDADEAVRKIRNSQQDALAVAGITLNGA